MPGYNIQIDDLVLYFKDSNGQDAYRWVPLEIYTDPALGRDDLDAVAPGWQGDILSEKTDADDNVYYVSNLSRLIDPHTAGNIEHTSSNVKIDGGLAQFAKDAPGQADLIIVPNEQHTAVTFDGFLLPRELIEACPALTPKDVPDIAFMANEEGVVVANIRKFERTGISCYLINLQGLVSNAPAAALGAAKKKGRTVAKKAPLKKAKKSPAKKAKKARKT